MNNDLLKAWVHWVIKNPMSEDQQLHAKATKDLLDEHEKVKTENERIKIYLLQALNSLDDIRELLRDDWINNWDKCIEIATQNLKEMDAAQSEIRH